MVRGRWSTSRAVGWRRAWGAHWKDTGGTRCRRGDARSEFDAVTEWFRRRCRCRTRIRRSRRYGSGRCRTPCAGHGRTGFEHPLGIGMSIQVEPLRQYTLGVLSLALADTTAAAAAGATLQRLAASVHANALVRDSTVACALRLERGRPEQALRLLEAMESRDTVLAVAATPCVSRASERFLRGEPRFVRPARRGAPVVRVARCRLGDRGSARCRRSLTPTSGSIHERLGKPWKWPPGTTRGAWELGAMPTRSFCPLVDTARRGLATTPPR